MYQVRIVLSTHQIVTAINISVGDTIDDSIGDTTRTRTCARARLAADCGIDDCYEEDYQQ